jgi:predicted MFS family arabinose efflux permease
VRGAELPLVVFAEFFQWLVLVIASVNEISLRQTLAPARLQGRVNATMRFINAGFVPIGSLLGGALGDAYGLRAALVVGVAGMFVAFFFVLLSPLRTLRTQPTAADDELDAQASEAQLVVV